MGLFLQESYGILVPLRIKIQLTQVSDGETEKQRSSYPRISGGRGTRTQAPFPDPISLPPSDYYSK